MGGSRSQRPLWPKGEPRHCPVVRVGTLTSLRLGECVWLRHGTWMSEQGLGAEQIGDPLRDTVVPEAGVEPVREKISRDFKSRASANSAIPANYRPLFQVAIS